VGIRRGHAGGGVGVPRHDAESWGRAVITLDQPVDEIPAASRGAVASAPRHADLGIVARGKRNPFAPVWNRLLFRETKRRVPIPVFAVGGIRTGVEARQIVDDGEADMVGFGRPFYAQGDLAEHILGDGNLHALCQSSNMCVPAQMLGMKGVCYNPKVKKLQP